jgi:hypothetical protein
MRVQVLAACLMLTWLTGSATAADQTPPPAAVPADFAITLEVGGCLGVCPSYSVSVDAKGHVTYVGEGGGARVTGRRKDRISRAQVAALAETVDRIGFFGLKDLYMIPVTDMPFKHVTVTRHGRTKRIEDEYGAPPQLAQFERQILEITRARRWTLYDERELLEALANGGRLSTQELSGLVMQAVRAQDAGLVRVLFQFGLDPNEMFAGRPLLVEAWRTDVARALLDAGSNPNARTPVGGNTNGGDCAYTTPLGHATLREVDFAAALLGAGAQPDQPCDKNGGTPLWHAACEGHVEMVKLLLKAGADPNLTPAGETAIVCAERNKKAHQADPLMDRMEQRPYPRDYDGVIAALTEAIAARSR